ncbi:LysR family transcriptional regulator [Alicyclobacillaceae bacterium I2511]|nr:LysR family transcriptional regulator [Alicyclobacillaceae bacterium I2511]
MNSLYRTFVQVVEQQTLVRAASHLHLTQPTVTRQLQQLEQQLGVRLFERIGHRLVLSRTGELAYGYAKSFLALEEKMQDELNSLANPEMGTIYMGAGLTPSLYLLPAVWGTYRKKHPQVYFQVRNGSSRDLLRALIDREIDLAVVTTVETLAEGWVTVPLWRDELILVTAPGGVLTGEAPVVLEELSLQPFVMLHGDAGLRRLLDDWARQRGVSWQVVMETDSLEALNRLVQQGVGLAFLPRSSVREDLAKGNLTVVNMGAALNLTPRTISLVHRAVSALPACAAAFCADLPGLCGQPADLRKEK